MADLYGKSIGLMALKFTVPLLLLLILNKFKPEEGDGSC